MRLTHPLYEWSVRALHSVAPWSDFDTDGFMVAAVATLLLAYVVLGSLREASGRLRPTMTLALVLAHPLALYLKDDGNYYFGYLPPNTIHNPTLILCKPFALMLFLWGARVLETKRSTKISQRTVLLGGILTLLTDMAKPNFILCFLPALAVAAAYLRLWRGRWSQLWTLALGTALPAIAAMAWEYFTLYGTEAGAGDGIQFAPLALMHIHSQHIPEKLLLSIAFPLVVYALDWRQAVKNFELNFAWLVYGSALAFVYLFAESGPRFLHGNFLWTGQVAALVLYVASARFWIRRGEPRHGHLVAAAVLAAHAAYGLGYLWDYSHGAKEVTYNGAARL